MSIKTLLTTKYIEMKTLQKFILTAVLLLAVNCYYSQDKEYTELYNSITPKLQKTAAIKQEFYGKKFSEFYKYLNNNHYLLN